jgi:hypothetical protein
MRSRRIGEYVAATAIAALAIAISPAGIELATGRTELTFRITCISVVLAAFLLMIAGAVLTQARIRRLSFALIAVTFPLAALACLEATAIALHLADRVAALEDISILDPGERYPGYLLSTARWQPGTHLYRPWQGPGISINADGLRTRTLTPKAAGEWRIAVTGGSAVFGWRMLDKDTVPARLQQSRHPANVTFFNFGIEGATVMQELAVLKQFREIYAIDQVIFFTGANDALIAYLDAAGGRKRLFDAVDGITSFELFKAATRFSRIISKPSAAELDRLDNEVRRQASGDNRLQAGLMAANEYCNEARLRCDFLLQPVLFTRSNPVGSELQLVRTFRQLYPGLAALTVQIYRDAVGSMPPTRVHDLSDMYNGVAEPVFTDNVHVNQLGNRIAAERIAATISFRSE